MYTSDLLSTSLLGLTCLSTCVLAVPVTFPNQLTGSFPQIAVPSQDLIAIETSAHGTLPGSNGPAPTGFKPDTLAVLQLIAFNELSEVAFFSQLLQNITNKVPGYTDLGSDGDKELTVKSLKSIIAQEELHALNALGALQANDASKVVQTCTYNFPVNTLDDAIALAITFTDVVLGTLGAAQSAVAATGDVALIPAIAAVIGQEGEQTGAFRVKLNKIPSELPFLTASDPLFAFSALNQLFVSNCPNSHYTPGQPAAAGTVQGIPIPILGSLTTSAAPGTASKPLTFTATLSSSDMNNYGSSAASKLAVTYINQQNAPLTVPITSASASGNTLTFTAQFPYDDANQGAFFGNGLTIGILTTTGTFKTAADVAKAALAGPALFENM